MIRASIESTSGTSYYGDNIVATANEIEAIVGALPEYDYDKSQRTWCAEFSYLDEDGDVCWTTFTIYDWKEFRTIGDDDVIDYHIGAFNRTESNKALESFKEEFKELIRKSQ